MLLIMLLNLQQNEEVVNAFVDNFIELEDIMMRNKHMDDSNNKVPSTIFMPKSIDLSKDRVRYRLKIGTIKGNSKHLLSVVVVFTRSQTRIASLLRETRASPHCKRRF